MSCLVFIHAHISLFVDLPVCLNMFVCVSVWYADEYAKWVSRGAEIISKGSPRGRQSGRQVGLQRGDNGGCQVGGGCRCINNGITLICHIISQSSLCIQKMVFR